MRSKFSIGKLVAMSLVAFAVLLSSCNKVSTARNNDRSVERPVNFNTGSKKNKMLVRYMLRLKSSFVTFKNSIRNPFTSFYKAYKDYILRKVNEKQKEEDNKEAYGFYVSSAPLYYEGSVVKNRSRKNYFLKLFKSSKKQPIGLHFALLNRNNPNKFDEVEYSQTQYELSQYEEFTDTCLQDKYLIDIVLPPNDQQTTHRRFSQEFILLESFVDIQN